LTRLEASVPLTEKRTVPARPDDLSLIVTLYLEALSLVIVTLKADVPDWVTLTRGRLLSGSGLVA
jgi:hypothetical protein